MGRKRKPITKQRRAPIRQWLEYQSTQIERLSGEVHALCQLISALVEKYDRQHASAIAVNMENARLRMAQEKEPADAAPTP